MLRNCDSLNKIIMYEDSTFIYLLSIFNNIKAVIFLNRYELMCFTFDLAPLANLIYCHRLSKSIWYSVL